MSLSVLVAGQTVAFGFSADFLQSVVACLVIAATGLLLVQRSSDAKTLSLLALGSVGAILSASTTTLFAALSVVLLAKLISEERSSLSALLSVAAVTVWFGTCIALLNVAKTTSFAEIFPQEVTGLEACFWALAAVLWTLSLLGERSIGTGVYVIAGSISLVDRMPDLTLGMTSNAAVVLVGAAGAGIALWTLRGSVLGIAVIGLMVVLEESAVAGAGSAVSLGLAAVLILVVAAVALPAKAFVSRVLTYSTGIVLFALSFAVSYSYAAIGKERLWLVLVLGLSASAFAAVGTIRFRGFLSKNHHAFDLLKGAIAAAAGIAFASWGARLIPGQRLQSFDFLSVFAIGGGFAFGYWALSLLFLGSLVWAVLVLLDIGVVPELTAATTAPVSWPSRGEAQLEAKRGALAGLITRLDSFLVGQPKLATVVLAVLVYLVFVR